MSALDLRHLVSWLRWGMPAVLLALATAGLPFLALTQPPADPTITLIHTGSSGLALVTDTRGRHLVLGGSEARTAATALLDRHLPPWDRRLSLLLVPPPHAASLPGALDLLDRRPVAHASLLALASRPHPTLDAWQARQRQPPVTGRAMIALASDTRLLLDTGDEPAGGAALALVERGQARLLLLFGDAAPLVVARHAAGHLPPPTIVARLTPQAAALPPSLRPSVVITLDDPGAAAGAGPRTVALAPGQALRITLQPDRLRLQGDLLLDPTATP